MNTNFVNLDIEPNMINSFKGSFSFKNEVIRETRISENVFLRVQKVNPAVVRVYFVDENLNDINIPVGFEIFDLTNNVVTNPFPGHQDYGLAWSDSYEFRYNGEPIIHLFNQRQWAIKSTSQREIKTILDSRSEEVLSIADMSITTE